MFVCRDWKKVAKILRQDTWRVIRESNGAPLGCKPEPLRLEKTLSALIIPHEYSSCVIFLGHLSFSSLASTLVLNGFRKVTVFRCCKFLFSAYHQNQFKQSTAEGTERSGPPCFVFRYDAR
jgi:hypothetical protein